MATSEEARDALYELITSEAERVARIEDDELRNESIESLANAYRQVVGDA
ncbi:hypothetical protein J4H92_04665 [Leucobacter weissii]|uniref:Uncharacterized protein n=1 Tax=Leucobacter weissii TaxID=1983706 RepID=A0A939S5E0_9MICO|nr:hypothetical protein [Leucobacter weissii]MBO1901239.1 hypothetical protein [Leucobacter weissii]